MTREAKSERKFEMHVDVDASKSLTRRITRADARGLTRRAAKLRAKRRRVDDRFDPPKAIAATVRYLQIAKQKFAAKKR